MSCKLLSNCSVPPEEVTWLREKSCVFLWVVKDTEIRPGSLADRTHALNREHCSGSQREMTSVVKYKLLCYKTALGTRLLNTSAIEPSPFGRHKSVN